MRYVLTIDTDEAVHSSALVQFAEARSSVDPCAHIRVILQFNDYEEI